MAAGIAVNVFQSLAIFGMMTVQWTPNFESHSGKSGQRTCLPGRCGSASFQISDDIHGAGILLPWMGHTFSSTCNYSSPIGGLGYFR